jgi:hypothetical protein
MDSFRVSRGGRRENRFPGFRVWRSAWRQPAAVAARAVSPRLPHAGGNNSLGFEHRGCFEATAGVGLARVGLSGLATERLNRLGLELEKHPENVTVQRLTIFRN